MARRQETKSLSRLNATERSLIEALRRGVPWDKSFRDQFQSDLGASDAQTASDESGQDKGGTPPRKTVIDADLLRALIVVEGAAARGVAPPIREAEIYRKADLDPTIQLNVRGIEIESAGDDDPIVVRCRQFVDTTPVFDLRGVCFPKRLALQGCTFEGPEGEPVTLLLDDAQIGTIDLSGARFQDLNGHQLCLTGDFCGASMKARSINLSNAEIGGNLNLESADLEQRHGIALHCNGTKVGKNVGLHNNFKAAGEVNFVTARIGNQLNCSESRFIAGETGRALNCNGSKIDDSVFLNNGFKSEGEVSFVNAHIGGQLSSADGQFTAGGTGCALDCNGTQIDDSVFLRNGFKAKGEVNFLTARIGGQLDCNRGQFIAVGSGEALACNSAQINESVFLSGGFKAEGEVVFAGACIGGQLNCTGGKFKAGETGRALDCNGARIAESVFLREGFKAKGEVNFSGTSIGGQLSSAGGQFATGETGCALGCNGAQIDESVFLSKGFRATGEVDFAGAHIGGQLNCTGGQFKAGETGRALDCNGAQIDESVFLNDGFKAEGEVSFVNARIGGQLGSAGGQFTAGESGWALHCNGTKIDDSVSLREGFEAKGEVNFAGAHIGGQLSSANSQFTAGKTGFALHCNGARIAESVFLREGFKAKGEVNFAGARIGGQLSSAGGQFTTGETGCALGCNGARIDESVFLSEGFRATGEVDFAGAHIGGQLNCAGGQFTAGGTGRALDCNGAQIDESVFLRGRFKAEGKVNFAHARIGKNLDLSRCAITVPGKSADGDWEAQPCVLNLDSSYIADQLFLPRPNRGQGEAPIRGSIDLQNAHCRILHDSELPKTAHAPRQWVTGWIKLEGLTYDRLGVGAPKLARDRKRWLDRQPKADRRGKRFKPQPYEQLSKVLREMGHISSARSIAVAKQWRMHHSGNLHPSAYVFRWLALWPAGYGYRPQYPFVLAVALVLLGNVVFETAYRAGYMSPAQPHAAIVEINDSVRAIGRNASAEAGSSAPVCSLVERSEVVPPFNGIVYTLDTFIPLVDLDQETSWKPSQARRCIEGLDRINPGPLWWRQNWLPQWAESGMVSWMPGWFVFVWKWGLMVSGFLITALIAASLSGLIRKD